MWKDFVDGQFFCYDCFPDEDEKAKVRAKFLSPPQNPKGLRKLDFGSPTSSTPSPQIYYGSKLQTKGDKAASEAGGEVEGSAEEGTSTEEEEGSSESENNGEEETTAHINGTQKGRGEVDARGGGGGARGTGSGSGGGGGARRGAGGHKGDGGGKRSSEQRR